jgi:hypothetical protein
MGFPRRAMSSNQAIERFGDRLRSEVDRIGLIAGGGVAKVTLSAKTIALGPAA